MSFGGVVFDLDGTMLDNMPFHTEAFAIFAQRHSLPPLTTDLRARLDGKRNRDIFPVLFGRELADDELARFANEKEALYRELSRGRLTPLPGLHRLLDLLHRHGLATAVATSAPLENVGHTLGELGLAERLPLIARSDAVGRGKPHPDVFLAAARLIAVEPRRCLGFEDAPSGVAAVCAAGMTCVAVTTSFSAARLREAGVQPHHAVADYDEFLVGPGAWLVEG